MLLIHFNVTFFLKKNSGILFSKGYVYQYAKILIFNKIKRKLT